MILRMPRSGWVLGFLVVWGTGNLAAQSPSADLAGTRLEIRSVEASGKTIPIRGNGEVKLGSFPENVIFHFDLETNSGRLPIRLRYKLEGYQNTWQEGDGNMYLGVRFFNSQGDQVSQATFTVSGESAGWNGSLRNSSLTHRRETVKVPEHASRVMLVMSSAGPPATEGVYVIANMVMTKLSDSSPAAVLMPCPFDLQPFNTDTNPAPRGWMRDGNHASMAKVVIIGKDSATKAFAILDDDPFSHAEWHSTSDTTPSVTPGDDLVVEWNEMFSMGVGDFRSARYDNLVFGNYKFRVQEVDIFGKLLGSEASLAVVIPPPFWQMPWFWGAVLAVVATAVFGAWRYLVWYRIRTEILQLKNQQALERERLRIARDIHDDLGARVTQISLLSAMSVENAMFPERARADFDRISRMSRELVSALYETVWAVNPENDNLDALGNYLCQMVNQLCERSKFRCRFHVSELSREIQVSSQTRHNISMAVKEAVHNVIKHAEATEVVVRIAFNGRLLTISIQDDGHGFQPESPSTGNGLTNMKQRLENIGGRCFVVSHPGKGATVHVELVIKTPGQN